ncbi:MAG: asparagine--tRNA ligase [Finegoldia magna]|uniref:Asparagine--tRNA ligase n=2 Tax=Finegoldia magna TaxID=1260 RepID=D6SA90_FINMA|nr:asparagine--tRNA ligase [Finegoldia magna]EFH92390.1 asparagine--tRNA ligase [Finegoldia magna ATCC 53516]MBS5966020.1 asparagine--tRNA ligase [Finegoldia magna]MCA5587839.1 asparagine--tRNA ligase [Finegoldia magna]MCC2716608.1 asparagine--tRNA ligase [Finegoldia magna]MDU1580102.1 asparagine--tRNA ligase [Finegoldia magna]
MILIRDLIKDYEKYSDKEVEVGGWIKNSRFSKNVGFIELNDGTFFNPVQIVVGKDNEDFEKSEKLKLSSAIIVVGKLVLTPNSKQPFEIQASKVIVEGESTDDYPLQKKRHTFEFLRTILHLRPRTNTFNAVFRVRSRLAFAIHKFFNERGFVYVHTPIITGSDAEGAGEMFRVTTLDLDNIPKDDDGNVDFSQDFFSKSTNLTVSGQLQAEAYALAFRNVYTFGPTFRSEHSNTPRHAAEFWMMEPEICFADLDDVCNLAEDMVRYIIKDVMENCEEEIKFFNSFVDKNLIERLTKVANKSFKKLTYTEAVEILQKSGEKFEYPVEWGMDLQTEHEKYLSEKVVDGPVFVTDYPKEIKAFYMRLNDDNKTVAATDLLVPGIGELIGGSQREERYELLDKKMDELGFNKEEYKWYLDLRKYGGVKHGGFGLGFERMVMYMTGMSNIRDVIPFPRTVGHCEY